MSKGKSLAYKPGAGATRDYYAIKAFLDTNNVLIQEVADRVEVHHSIVSQTIRGTRNSRRVLKHLKDMNCPENILSLPDDMQNK